MNSPSKEDINAKRRERASARREHIRKFADLKEAESQLRKVSHIRIKLRNNNSILAEHPEVVRKHIDALLPEVARQHFTAKQFRAFIKANAPSDATREEETGPKKENPRTKEANHS